MDDVKPQAQTALTTVNLNTASFVRSIVNATMQDVDDAYYTSGEMCEDAADKALNRILGRMKALEAFLLNLQ